MELRGDPVLANQIMMFLFLSFVCMIIYPWGVIFFISVFSMFLKSLSIRLIVFQFSINSVMYIVGSGSLVSISSSSSSGGSISCVSSSFIFFTFLVCECCLCGYCPLFLGSGVIYDLHNFAKCPLFFTYVALWYFCWAIVVVIRCEQSPALRVLFCVPCKEYGWFCLSRWEVCYCGSSVGIFSS